jgi:diguanylate cyclase (GGDEF)-like protein
MPLKDCTVLFIEDNTLMQEHMKLLLEDDVKEIYQAFDGRIGLELYKEKKPDIVITDYELPYLNGLELTSKIKTYKKEQNILIMSAHTDKNNLLSFINAKSDGFIPKPMDVDYLYEKLNEIACEIKEKAIKEKETKEDLDKLRQLAYYDSLTHLPNNLYFNQQFDDYIQEASKESLDLSLLFIDLDYFKKVNDTYGHEAGDFTLKKITSKMSQIISKDDLVARRSGDEFLILLKNKSQKYIQKIAQDLLSVCSQNIQWCDDIFNLSCSIGISQFPKDSTKKDELLRFSDLAMYNAKKQGKNMFSFYSQN